MWVTILTSKDEAAGALALFQAAAEAESERKLRTLRTDRGGEFMSGTFAAHCAETGVQRHLTVLYSPQQNGVVERRNHTIVATARSMLKAKGVPSYLWGEAVLTVVHVLNRSFTRSVAGKTPFEAWYGTKLNVHYLRTFGCVAHVKTAHPHLKKLDDRSTRMVFIGYKSGTKVYRAFVPVAGRVHVSL